MNVQSINNIHACTELKGASLILLSFAFFSEQKKRLAKRSRFKGLNTGKIAVRGQKDHCEMQKSPRKGERGKKGTTRRSPLSIVSGRSAATQDRCPAHCPPSASSLPPGPTGIPRDTFCVRESVRLCMSV